MDEKISVIGGDLRIVKLINLLEKDGFKILTYGLEKSYDIQDYQKSNTLEQCIENSKIIVSAIPFSTDGININSPFSNIKIQIQDVLNKLRNTKFIAGAIKHQFIEEKNENNNVKIIDILENESLIIKNAIPSAEGAIQIAMENSYKTLHGSNVLVMGFGRIGKILSKMLSGIGANVYCEARKEQDLAWIQAYGYNAVDLKCLQNKLSMFDFIFNTIPVMILDKTNLEQIRKDCLIIDVASKPGGVNFDVAKELNIKTIWALGLPGKVAPETAAQYIKDEIIKC